MAKKEAGKTRLGKCYFSLQLDMELKVKFHALCIARGTTMTAEIEKFMAEFVERNK